MVNVKAYDGNKAVNLNDLPEEAWDYLVGGGDNNNLYEITAFLYSVIQRRAGAVRSLPRRITTLDGDEVPEDEVDDQMGLMIDIGSMLFRSSIALDLYGAAYMLAMGDDSGDIRRVRWLHPKTIDTIFNNAGELKKFTRTLGAGDGTAKYEFDYKRDEDRAYPMRRVDEAGKDALAWNGLVWAWGEGMQEIGPSLPPADVAEPAAEILRSIDVFARNFFARGAIAQHLIKSSSNPPEPEKSRIRSILKRALFGGTETSHGVEVVNSDIEVEKVGSDPADLAMPEVDAGNQRDICAALLTPMSIITGEANNRSVLDRITSNWINDVVAPHGDIAVRALNHHVFKPMGLMLSLDAQGATVNQEDEKDRSVAVANLVMAGETLQNAYMILGYDLPSGYEAQQLAAPEPEPETGPMPLDDAGDAPDEADMPDALEVGEERGRLRRWAKNRMGGAPPDPAEFDTDLLTPGEKAIIILDLARENGDAVGDDTPFTRDGKATRKIPDESLNPSGRDMRRHERNGRDAVADALSAYYSATWDGIEEDTVSVAVRRASNRDVLQPLQDTVTAWLQTVATDGATFGRAVIEREVFGVKAAPELADWELANNAAAEWAIEYGQTLTGMLAKTTTERIQREIAAFIRNGETLEELIDRVQDGYLYSRERAEAIAVTETTRAFARGNIESYRAAGVVQQKRWNTAQDELVCPYCSSVSNQVVGLDDDFESALVGRVESPPAHTRCRCWITPVVTLES